MNFLTAASDRSRRGLSFSGTSACCVVCSSALAAFAITSLPLALLASAGARIVQRHPTSPAHGRDATMQRPGERGGTRRVVSVQSPLGEAAGTERAAHWVHHCRAATGIHNFRRLSYPMFADLWWEGSRPRGDPAPLFRGRPLATDW